MTRFPTYPQRVLAGALSAVLASGLALAPAPAHADPTAAEKQAEADAIMAQIDEHQTALNKANESYVKASAEYDAAMAAVGEAQKKIDEESAHIERLQDSLGSYAAAMYKQDGGGSYLELLLGTGSLSEFLRSWEAIAAITGRNAELVEEAKEARETYRLAQETLREQGERAAAEKEIARAAQEEAAAMHDSLMSEAARITAEVAALEAQEEALADEARKAEEERAAAEAAASRELEVKAEAAQAAAEAAEAATEAAKREAEEKGIDTTQPVSYTLLQNPCPAASSSSGFGYRSFDNSFHKGLDMAAASGTPYYAAESGTVVYATNDGGYNGGAGNWVVISHGSGLVTKYMHSSETLVKPGEMVTRGQHIGNVGETGQAFGAHLHFQVEVNGTAVNPLNYI